MSCHTKLLLKLHDIAPHIVYGPASTVDTIVKSIVRLIVRDEGCGNEVITATTEKVPSKHGSELLSRDLLKCIHIQVRILEQLLSSPPVFG